MPMTAFIGVRISWLMFARNSVFARLAASAASRAAVSSPSTRFRSPMSLEIDTKPATAPSRRRSDVLRETQKTSPCRVTLRMSPRNPPARVAAVIFSARPGGFTSPRKSCHGFPRSSSRVQPERARTASLT